MKNIYVIMSKTNTKIGKFIRIFTNNNYNHVSISIYDDLSKMYSFARIHKNKAFEGGFVEESWLRYLDNSDYIEFIVYSIPVKEEEYLQAKEFIETIYENRNTYKYNYRQAVGNYLNLPQMIKSEKNFTCLSFSVNFLKRIGAVNPSIKIKSIRVLQKVLLIYTNESRIISKDEIDEYEWNNDRYLEEDSTIYDRVKVFLINIVKHINRREK